MNSFTSMGLREAYRKVEQLGDKLSDVSKLEDWEAFRLQLEDMYNNKTEKGAGQRKAMKFISAII